MNQPFSIETTTIGLMLFNPTSEDLDMQYAGVSLTMKSGEKHLYEIACAKHLLNAFGQRGLTSLTYGCDEEKVRQAAVERNHEFKVKQVVDYNQRNENRKMMNLGFLPPTPFVKKYALELGINLLEPYNVREEERAGIAAGKMENEALKQEMAELKEMMKQLMNKEPETSSEERVRKDGKWVKKEGT
jgi:hypothetical protein